MRNHLAFAFFNTIPRYWVRRVHRQIRMFACCFLGVSSSPMFVYFVDELPRRLPPDGREQKIDVKTGTIEHWLVNDYCKQSLVFGEGAA